MEYIENYNEFYKLLKNYTNVFYKNLLIRFLNNSNYLEMLYVKGLLLLKNIYILLFIYSENINEIILLSEKAYIYYIEFLIQINLNSTNLELTFRDAVLFTYKRTLLSYTKQSTNNRIKENMNKELTTYLNILCNIFYLIDNRNFIEYNEEQIANTININSFVINKLNTIEQLENKLRKYIIHSNDLSGFNNNILQLRDLIEKKINYNSNNKFNNKINNKLNNKINNQIHYLLDNYKTNESNITLEQFLLD
jgi:hypothetical protein